MFANVGRAWNQIRQSILLDRFNVNFIVREGILHELGVSHATTEGVASCRVLANLVVLCPADAVESAKAAQAMLDYVGPVVLKTEMGPPPLQDLQRWLPVHHWRRLFRQERQGRHDHLYWIHDGPGG